MTITVQGTMSDSAPMLWKRINQTLVDRGWTVTNPMFGDYRPHATDTKKTSMIKVLELLRDNW